MHALAHPTTRVPRRPDSESLDSNLDGTAHVGPVGSAQSPARYASAVSNEETVRDFSLKWMPTKRTVRPGCRYFLA